MNKKKKKRWHLLLYSVIAAIVLLSLIVLPLADTDNPDPSADNTQYIEDESLNESTSTASNTIALDSAAPDEVTEEDNEIQDQDEVGGGDKGEENGNGDLADKGEPGESGNLEENKNSEGDKEPVDAENPEGNKEPVDTGDPEGNKEPVDTGDPEGDKKPVDIGDPEGDKEPVDTGNPEGDIEPVDTGNPEGDKEPVDTGDPEGDKDPEDTKNPEEDPEDQDGNNPKEVEKPGNPKENEDSEETNKEDKESKEKPDTEKAPKRTEYDYQDNDIIVKAVFTDAAAVPDNAELFVTPITEETNIDQYNEVEARINDSVQAENQLVTSFLAYDIYFMADGIEYEPELGNVNVTIQYKSELLDSSIKSVSDEIKVLHLRETAEGILVEDVTQEVSLINFGEYIPVNNNEQLNNEGKVNSGTGTEAGEGTGTGTGTGTGAGTEVGTGAGTGAGTGTGTGVGTGADSGAGTGEGTGTGSGTGSGTDSGADSGAGTGEGTGTGSGIGSGTGTEASSGAGLGTGSETGAGISTGTEGGINSSIGLASGLNVIRFVTNSFSTFVVTGISKAKPAINVTMRFLDLSGSVDTGISGTYYLNITNTSSNYRYNKTLNIINGTVTTQIDGLYDQNGNGKGDGSLYPLTNATYKAVLFKYPSVCPSNFKWDDNDLTKVTSCVKYGIGAEIVENYLISEFSSIFVINSGASVFSITANAKAGTKFSSGEILSLLTPVRPYSVFASQFDLVSDMEGSIAVQKANLKSNFGNSSNNFKYFSGTTIRSISVKKIYNGTVQKTFKFGLFKNGVLYDTTTVTLPTTEGKNVATISFPTIDSISNYSVYELTDSNTKLAVGDKYNGFTLTSMNMENITTSSSINSTSYIEKILSSNATPLRQGTASLKNSLVVGAGYTVSRIDNRIYLYESGSEIMNAEYALCDISVANGSFPIHFDETLTNLATLSERLATALSSDTIMVKSMTIAELNSKENQELTFDTNGRMLLLNIDATGATNISLSANAKLVVNGESCAGWSKEANNIIVNIFTKSGNSYAPYTGNITNAGYVMGTLLTPRANVNSLGQNYNGNIVAKYVCNAGGEVHGNTLGVTTVETIYEFANSAIGSILLPMTGGMGTQIFYKLGFGIILLGIVVYAFYQRFRNEHYNRSG